MTPNGWRLWQLLGKPAHDESHAWPLQPAWGRVVWWVGCTTLASLFLTAVAVRLWLQVPLLGWLFSPVSVVPSMGLLLFSAACCGLLTTFMLRLVRLSTMENRASLSELALPGAAVLGLLLLLSEGSLSQVPVLLGLGIVLASEGAFWGYLLGREGRRGVPTTAEVAAKVDSAVVVSEIASIAHEFRDSSQQERDLELEGEFDEERAEGYEAEAGLFQRWSRQRDLSSGQETFSGILRADFPAGDPLAVLHVSFCPPLASVPELMCEISGELSPDAPEASVRVTLAETFGARIEVRLQQRPTECVTLFVEMFGSSALASQKKADDQEV